jgi:hypothetical protein
MPTAQPKIRTCVKTFSASFRLTVLFTFFLVTISVVFAQAPVDDPDSRITWPETHRSDVHRMPLARKNVWVFEYRFTAEEKRLLQPSADDQQRYAGFLRLPDTGLIRLYPWKRRPGVISVQELRERRSPEFSSHACLFSFTKGRHGNALNGFVDPRLGWGELKLVEGKFFTGFTGESLRVLVSLGDTPLETVTPETDSVRGLTNIVPPADYLEASALSRRNRAGFQLDRFKYGSSLPIGANTTYVLRSTSNKRADLLVSFRVIRLSPDGSATILWRKLKSYPKPAWKRREE